MTTPQVELWKSDFGNDYTRRNARADLVARIELWKLILPRHCESVLEVGANVGINLQAIGARSICELYACEPNELAREELSNILPETHMRPDTADSISYPNNIADLVFTSGVLIHIPTDQLLPSMKEMHRCARRFIICGEYFAPQEEMITYRGKENALWRRDYGSLWLDNFPDLRCTGTIFAWKRTTGLDNLTFWMFEKSGQH